MKSLILRAGAERRVLRGHRWIFSNEIAGELPDYEPGSWVTVATSRGSILGSGYVNPHSLISVRLVCPPGIEPSRAFFSALLSRAASFRQRIYPGSTCHRLVHGESDGLPGLIVDRYGDMLVVQITTMGMARLETLITELLLELFQPRLLVYRNDTPSRALEGLPLEKGVAFGELPGEPLVELNGLKLLVDLLDGQKTGLYLDQRDNREALARWVHGRRVLDLFCYDGAWGLLAASHGASRVMGVDSSVRAIQRARKNARNNHLDERCAFHQSDVFLFLKNLERASFDVIISDPPAFAKSRKALAEAQKGYVDLNRRALLALAPGGILVTCSCSHHVDEDLFRTILAQAAQASGRQLRILETRGQALDHPVLLAMPETRYLKCCFMEVL